MSRPITRPWCLHCFLFHIRLASGKYTMVRLVRAKDACAYRVYVSTYGESPVHVRELKAQRKDDLEYDEQFHLEFDRH